MKKPDEITIIGAGLVGSLLAVMLGQRGYRVRVFERRPDMRGKQISAGRSINLALAERGIHALKQAGLFDQVRPLLIPMRGRLLHDVHGRLEFLPYGQRRREVIYSVSRGELNSLMMTAAESHPQVSIEFEQSLESIDFEANKITVKDVATGATRTMATQILIGADGAGSRVRRALIPHVGGVDDSQLLDHDYKELTIPAGPGGGHRIKREALHIWPRGGYMLIALPNLDGSFTVTLFLQKIGVPSFEWLDRPERVIRFFEEQFPDALVLIPDLATEFFEHPQGILGTVQCYPWIDRDNVMLIGDAAHAVVPFHGQGMNAGFEDCELFIGMLERHRDDWTAAMLEFNETRKPDADAIAQMALENYVVMRDSVLDPQFQLKKELGFLLEQRWPDRFVPRYSMVMFHRIPYAEVLKRGIIEDQIMERLLQSAESVEEVDMELAEQLVMQHLEPITDGLVSGDTPEVLE